MGDTRYAYACDYARQTRSAIRRAHITRLRSSDSRPERKESNRAGGGMYWMYARAERERGRKEGKGKERKGKERKGKERKGRKGRTNSSMK